LRLSIIHQELSFLLQLLQALENIIYGSIAFSFARLEEFLNLVGEFRNKFFDFLFHRLIRRLFQL